MKILIVEDEYWVRKSIVSMLEKETTPDMEIREAENGEEAIAFLQESSADIILTDIEMPFVDGIKLIQWIKENRENSVVGVISGYSDFPLVKEALLNGALDYILKPVKLENLIECMEKMKQAVYKKKQDTKRMEQQKRTEMMYQSYLQDMEFSRYLTAKQEKCSIDIEGCGIQPPYRMMVVRYRGQTEENKNSIDRILMEKERIKEKLKNIFETKAVFWNTFKGDEYVIFTMDVLMECREKALCVRTGEKDFLCISIGERKESFHEIPMEYRSQLLKIVKNARYTKKQEIFDYTQPDPSQYEKLARADRYLDSLKKELENRNADQVQRIVMDYMGLGRICEEEWYFYEIRQVMQRIRSVVSRVFQADWSDQDQAEEDSLFDSMEQALDTENTKEFMELAGQALKFQSLRDLEPEEKGEDDLIEKVKQYIVENYMDNISLSDIAEKFFVTPSHLSRSFKKAEGINLISFITEKRMQEAKKYMEKEDFKLSEIAFLVGYDDYTYFNKVFKRYTGYSPKDYQLKFKKPE